MLKKQSFLAVFIPVLTLFSFSQNAPRQEGPAAQISSPASLALSSTTSVDTADPEAVAGQKQIDGYTNQVRDLLNQEKFGELDKLATTARASKGRMPGGSWTLYLLYLELSKVPNGDRAPEADWTAAIARFQSWIAQRPESITARVALANMYVNYAWQARGNGYADEVSARGWELYKQRIQLARQTLEDASTLKQKCPEWFHVMQTVALAQAWDKAEALALFEKAIAFEPNYYYYYLAYSNFLLPKWYGEEGESEAFLSTAASKVGASTGDITYYKVARDLVCVCADPDSVQTLDWARIQRGFAANEKLYGVSTYELNKLAYMAVKFLDVDQAYKTFNRIGDHWDPDTWNSRNEFEGTKQGAMRLNDMMAAVKANLQTPAGLAYDTTLGKEFGQKFAAAMNDCVTAANGDLRDFTIYMQMTQDGKVGQVVVLPSTAVDTCLAPKLYASGFSAPPAPAYWVHIQLKMKPDDAVSQNRKSAN